MIYLGIIAFFAIIGYYIRLQKHNYIYLNCENISEKYYYYIRDMNGTCFKITCPEFFVDHFPNKTCKELRSMDNFVGEFIPELN